MDIFSPSVVSDSLQPHGLQHTRLPCPSPFPGACSDSCPSSLWCRPTISSSVVPFSTRLQSFPASGSFPMSWLFTLGGLGIQASASASVLPMNMEGWFLLGLMGLISLLFKGLPRVLSSTTVQKYQFFNARPSLWSNSHIHTWLLEKNLPKIILLLYISHLFCLSGEICLLHLHSLPYTSHFVHKSPHTTHCPSWYCKVNLQFNLMKCL